MKSKNLIYILSVLLTALVTGCASYQINPQDTTIRAVMQRWAQDNNKTLRWNIQDLALTDPVALNHQLEFTHNLTDAVTLFMNTAEMARVRLSQDANELRPPPIMACIYDNAIWVSYIRGASLACSG